MHISQDVLNSNVLRLGRAYRCTREYGILCVSTQVHRAVRIAAQYRVRSEVLQINVNDSSFPIRAFRAVYSIAWARVNSRLKRER